MMKTMRYMKMTLDTIVKKRSMSNGRCNNNTRYKTMMEAIVSIKCIIKSPKIIENTKCRMKMIKKRNIMSITMNKKNMPRKMKKIRL